MLTLRVRSECLATAFPIPSSSFSFSIDEALRKAGIDVVDDFNDPVSPAACTGELDVIADSSARRQSTYHGFLPSSLVKQRTSCLKVCTKTSVKRLQLGQEGDNIRATGVLFESADSGGQEFFASARREIVLCAGALVSPQILMLRLVQILRCYVAC